MVQVTQWYVGLLIRMAEGTGQSSQLFAGASNRHAQFLATVASSASGNVSL